jgi:hypothetical protein
MTHIIKAFLEATTTEEVTQLVFKHHEALDQCPFLWIFPRDARRRIHNLRRVKKLTWSISEQN